MIVSCCDLLSVQGIVYKIITFVLVITYMYDLFLTHDFVMVKTLITYISK